MEKFVGNTKDLIAWLEKREIAKQKRINKKQKLIQDVITNLKENLFDSQEFIFSLVHEALQNRTNKELLEILN